MALMFYLNMIEHSEYDDEKMFVMAHTVMLKIIMIFTLWFYLKILQ